MTALIGPANEAEKTEFASQIIALIGRTRTALTRDTLGEWFVNLIPENGTTEAPRPFCFDRPPFSEFDSHGFFEVAIKVDGCSLLQLEDRYYQLRPGQLAIVPRNTVHRLGFLEGDDSLASMMWMNVTGDMIRTGYTTYEKDSARKEWGYDLILPGSFIINEALGETKERPITPERLDAIVTYLQFFLMLIERKFAFVDEATEMGWNEQVANEIKYYISNHLNSSLRLQELADVVSISACHLSKIFKQATNQTITNYIQQCKIEKAIELLLSTTLSISQIASQLGFYDQYHFSKTFKAYTGFAPTVYRKLAEKPHTEGR